MRRLLLVIFAVANLGQAPAVKGGTVTGTVNAVVEGKVVKLDDVYVYLDRTPTEPMLVGSGTKALITQADRTFTPRITVVARGAKIYFPNNDNMDHSVFSPGVDKGWYGFDLGRYAKNKEGKFRSFSELGQFDIYCDVHKEMWAKVKVVPTRLFARVVDGKFTMTDVPPGTYTVVAWAPDSKEKPATRPIEVKPGTTVTAESLNVQYTPSSHVHNGIGGRVYGPYPTP